MAEDQGNAKLDADWRIYRTSEPCPEKLTIISV